MTMLGGALTSWMDVEFAVTRELRDALAFNLQSPDHEVAAHRAKFLANVSPGQSSLQQMRKP